MWNRKERKHYEKVLWLLVLLDTILFAGLKLVFYQEIPWMVVLSPVAVVIIGYIITFIFLGILTIILK